MRVRAHVCVCVIKTKHVGEQGSAYIEEWQEWNQDADSHEIPTELCVI